MKSEHIKTSKLLSYVLRHNPGEFGVTLDPRGWVDISTLLEALGKSGKSVSRETLEEVVQTNDKQRFAISEDHSRIRANQGHSIEVDLEYAPADPPEFLFHGTVDRFMDAIRAEGLKKMQRHHVHLSENFETAIKVGQRRGKPVILEVRAAEMMNAGHAFFVTPNRVWLTDAVPPEFIKFE